MIYEDHSIIKDTSNYEGKTIGERVMILSEQLVPVMTFDQLFE